MIGLPSSSLQNESNVYLLRLQSQDGTNRLTRECVLALQTVLRKIICDMKPLLVITGNSRFFSAGAELAEIAALNGPSAYEFSRLGQALMHTVEHFPAPVYAAVSGYCMGRGLDLALACHWRIASPNTVLDIAAQRWD